MVKNMTIAIIKVDNMGRVYLPSEIRNELGIHEGTIINMETRGEEMVLKKGRPAVEEGYGMFKTKRQIDDVDEELKIIVKKKVKKWSIT